MSSKAELLGWVVCANISDHLRGGTDPERFYQGTRMFSPGTKVYVGQAYWGMGQNIHAIGLRRVSRDFVNCAIDIGALENLRVTSVYSKSLWAKLEKLKAEVFDSKPDAERYLSSCANALKREGPQKLAPVEKMGPWGPYEISRYRTK